MAFIIGNWTQSTDWDVHQRSQRISDEDTACITTGDLYDTKMKEFSLYEYVNGDLFPAKSRLGARFPSRLGTFFSDVAYSAALIVHTPVTAVGNVVTGLISGAKACKDVWTKRKEEGFSKIKAFTPAGEQLFAGIKKAIVLVPLLSAWYNGHFSITNWNFVTVPVVASIVAWGVYSLYNPLGAMYTINWAEKKFNVKPLTDGQVTKLSWFDTVKHVLDGSYSLSRIFNIHHVGTKSDKVGDDLKFEKIEKKE